MTGAAPLMRRRNPRGPAFLAFLPFGACAPRP